MKSSYATPISANARRNSSELRSAHAWGVVPCAAADVTTLSACSSVPVSMKTSAPPASLWNRAYTSATKVV